MANAKTGRFVWFEYVSKNAPKAQAFYGELFNWRVKDVPMPQGSYQMIAVGDDTIGGFTPTPPGAPEQATWLSHLLVESASATAAKVKSLGGSIKMDAMAIGEMGTMAVVADPAGAPFALWQPTKADDASAEFRGKPGTWCWNELLAKDPAAATKFYAAIGGFTAETMSNGMDYTVLSADGQRRAGIMKPQMEVAQSWLPYVHVTDVKATAERAKRLGAQVFVEPTTIPNIGTFAVFADPLGASFAVLQPS